MKACANPHRCCADGQTKRPAERLTVIRTVQEKPQTWYTLSNAAEEVSPTQVARAGSAASL